MVKKHLRWVVEQKDRRGKVRLYFWKRPGPRIRLPGLFGSAEFMEAYGRALNGEEVAAVSPKTERAEIASIIPRSFRWLCTQYFASGEFRQLGDRTRRVRRTIIDGMCEETISPTSATKFADVPAAKITDVGIRVLRDRKAETPEAANSRIKALRQIFAYGKIIRAVPTNPAVEVPYFEGDGEGFHTWTIEEVQQFEKRHPIGTKARLALALLLYTGVRRSDVVTFGRQMIRDGWLHWTEFKGRKKIRKGRAIPILPELQAVIDATPSGNLAFLVTEFGKPFTSNGFGNWFRKRCNEADLPQCSAHGVRKAGATIAANNGATEHQLMAIFGWESPRQAANYTKKANRKKLAGDAIGMLVPGDQRTKPEAIVITARGGGKK